MANAALLLFVFNKGHQTDTFIIFIILLCFHYKETNKTLLILYYTIS